MRQYQGEKEERERQLNGWCSLLWSEAGGKGNKGLKKKGNKTKAIMLVNQIAINDSNCEY